MSPGRELDSLVAEKVMGWKWNEHTAWSPSGSTCARVSDVGCPPIDPWWWLPYYSSDISAAWEVVEKFRGFNPFWEEENSLNIEITPCHPSGWMVNFGDSTTIEYGESAPQAICRAAIKAVGFDLK